LAAREETTLSRGDPIELSEIHDADYAVATAGRDGCPQPDPSSTSHRGTEIAVLRDHERWQHIKILENRDLRRTMTRTAAAAKS
jgi:hypothetical protein